jgi:hypothetical protein
MHPIPLAAAIAVAASVVVPPAAGAATLHQDGRTPHRVLLQDASGETNLLSVRGTQSVIIEDLNAPITIAGVPTCMPLDAYTVSCAAVRRVELDLGAGTDHVNVDTRHAVAIEGGAGNDHYLAAASGVPSRVDFDGGIGFDTANYFYATAGVEVAVDLDGGDGRPGDDDRIRRDVESVVGSQFDDVLAGSDRTTRLSGNDGDDRIGGGSAAEELLGGAGDDRIDARDGASDTVDCGGQALDRALVDRDAEAAITGCAEVGG